MSFQLKVLSGPLIGRIFPAREGLTFGRRNADVILEDGRVSTRHAQIVKDSALLRLVDEESKNGVRDGRGQKVDSIDLAEGVRFTIGESEFEVLKSSTPAAPASVDSNPAPQPPKKKKPSVHWHEALASSITKRLGGLKDQPQELALFHPAVVLKFVRGPQVDTRWILGFGPRQIGPGSFDLPLWEADLPAICFHLTPSPTGAEFRTDDSNLVRLNGQSVAQHAISAGDSIEIRDTLIELDLIE